MGGAGFSAAAQSDDTWSPPVNISQSGSAENPALAVDADGGLHLFWQDAAAGFMVSEGNGRTWSDPLPVRLPFSEPPFALPDAVNFEGGHTPQLLIDDAGLAHGFWINGDGRLLYSRASLENITEQTGWTTPVTLAESAAALDAALGENGRLHLAYIRPQQTDQFPAGVYYRRSDDGGVAWEGGVSPYLSPYLAVPSNLAHVTLTAAGGNLFLGWDNRLLDSVFVARSGDGGETWETPVTMDSRLPEDDPDAAGPADVAVTAAGEWVHVTWHAEHTAGQCGQYHQWSRNTGVTWQPSPTMIGGASSVCPSSGQFIHAQNGLLLLMTAVADGVFLQAWDGDAWSEPDLQLPLTGFTHPQTFRSVNLGCRQTAVTADNRLIVVGCGSGDVWSLERPLGALAEWSDRFSPAPVWSEPQIVAAGPVQMAGVTMAAGEDGRLHAFWSQPEGGTLANQPGQAIYYARLNAGQWSPPRPVITSPDGKTDQPAVVADDDGRLFIVWSGGESGQIYFSRAAADRAASTAEWTPPLPLPSPREAGAWPDVALDAAGILYAAYTIPVNEDRGVYLTQSTDDGRSWSAPARVFDGAAAKWQMVGASHLAVAANGDLHLIWTRRTLPGGTGPLALVYARSVDGGQTWSEPEAAAQEAVVWSGLAAVGGYGLHRVWLADDDGRLTLRSQFSIDNGLTWSAPEDLFAPDAVGGAAALTAAADGPHLFQLAQNAVDGRHMLLEWVWDGAHWRQIEGAEWDREAIEMGEITAAAADDGRFGVIFADLMLDETGQQLQHELFYTERAGDAPVGSSAPLPTLTPAPPPQTIAAPLPEPSPTPPLTFSAPDQPDAGLRIGPLRVNSTAGAIAISVVPAALLLVLVVGVRIIRKR